MAKELTQKQAGFVKDYLETGNGVQSALKNYDTDDYSTAGSIAHENLQKPEIRDLLMEARDMAKSQIISLAKGADSEQVRLKASQDIVDRTEGKAVQRTDVTSDGKQLKVVLAHEIVDKHSLTGGDDGATN